MKLSYPQRRTSKCKENNNKEKCSNSEKIKSWQEIFRKSTCLQEGG